MMPGWRSGRVNTIRLMFSGVQSVLTSRSDSSSNLTALKAPLLANGLLLERYYTFRTRQKLLGAYELVQQMDGVDLATMAAIEQQDITVALFEAGTGRVLYSSRSEDAVRDELARTREERLEEAYERLSQEVGLSKRECEVMKMLAKGYTSVYICEELGFSAGTAKAHTAHIYQKLGIHRKDELLELVEKRVSEV